MPCVLFSERNGMKWSLCHSKRDQIHTDTKQLSSIIAQRSWKHNHIHWTHIDRAAAFNALSLSLFLYSPVVPAVHPTPTFGQRRRRKSEPAIFQFRLSRANGFCDNRKNIIFCPCDSTCSHCGWTMFVLFVENSFSPHTRWVCVCVHTAPTIFAPSVWFSFTLAARRSA